MRKVLRDILKKVENVLRIKSLRKFEKLALFHKKTTIGRESRTCTRGRGGGGGEGGGGGGGIG